MRAEPQSRGTPKFVDREELILFEDRRDGGRQLAGLLRGERTNDAVVVGLAHGGVIVAADVARALDLPLDALAVRKVWHRSQPETIGAVTPDGGIYLRSTEDLSEDEIERAVSETQAKVEELDCRLHGRREALGIAGKCCILVDEGLASGATVLAAVRWARTQGASRVIVAVPVGARETVSKVEAEVDDLICLELPELFVAVGMWYVDLGQVTDEEVIALLEPAADVPDARRSGHEDGLRSPADAVLDRSRHDLRASRSTRRIQERSEIRSERASVINLTVGARRRKVTWPAVP